MSSRKGKAMRVVGPGTSPDLWGVGEIFVAIVRTTPRLGEEGQKEFPTLLKRDRKSIEETGKEQRRELGEGGRENGKGREGEGEGEADEINWKRYIEKNILMQTEKGVSFYGVIC